MARSRLKSSIEKQAKRNIFLTIGGMIVIGVLLVVFGIPAIVNLSLLVGSAKSDQNVEEEGAGDIFVAAPMLDSLPKATNQPKVTVTGFGEEDQSIKVFVNGELKDETSTKEDGSFSAIDVPLTEGKNAITARAITKNDKESKDSDEATIMYLKEPPELSIDSPSDGQTISGGDNKNTEVRGKTSPDVKVTVNDFRAIVNDEGAYRYRLTLKDGENQIKVIATDEAGNKTEKEIKVTFSP